MHSKERLKIVQKACQQVSRGLFFSTIIIIASFLPIFLLTGQSGKLFSPLAYTKTFILLLDALLVITLAPVLLSFLMAKKIKKRESLIARSLEKAYRPLISWVLNWRKTTLALNLVLLLSCIPLLYWLDTEFMPPLDEQSILFMPVAMPDISRAEITRILQVQDQILASFPEVENVLGKAGRANTATDNAPLSMIETIILLKPQKYWRKGLTKAALIQEMDEKLQIPGVVNGFTQPIINRIGMLATGIRTDVGIKIFGQVQDTISLVASKLRQALSGMDGITGLAVEQNNGGKYLHIDIDREKIAVFGMSMAEVHKALELALSGSTITELIDGRRRFPIILRLAETDRNSLESLKSLVIRSELGGDIQLGQVAFLRFADGPAMISSENGMLYGALLFNVQGKGLAETVQEAMQKVQQDPSLLPEGYFLEWSGQYKHLMQAQKTLAIIAPLVVLIIFTALYFAFRSVKEALLSLITLPFALMGGVYSIYLADVNLSVAVAVGFIALLGIAVETGIVMVIYLQDALTALIKEKGNSSQQISLKELRQTVISGAAGRLRPKIMTVCVSLFGLIPILWSTGVGTDVMRPIVLPLIGGVLTSSVHILLVTPLIFLMSKEYELRKYGKLLVSEDGLRE